jgi:hypothetical protein
MVSKEHKLRIEPKFLKEYLCDGRQELFQEVRREVK